MANKVKFSERFLTVNGKRVRVFYSVGPWVGGVDPATIKVYPLRSNYFPREFGAAFAIENNSDMQTDYFESDKLRFVPGNPFYAQVKAGADAAEAASAARRAAAK